MNPQIVERMAQWNVSPERARTLNPIVHDLTDMHTRVRGPCRTIRGSNHRDKKAIIGLSEFSIKLSAQIGHYMDREEIKVYPTDVFAQILFEKATYFRSCSF